MMINTLSKGSLRILMETKSNPCISLYLPTDRTGVARQQDLLRYFQHIDRGLHARLQEETAPLVLAGVEYLFPLYQQANTYPHLLEQGVAGNPDKLRAETLREKA